MMQDVTDEEERREDKRRDHRCAVGGDLAGADERVADKKRCGTEAVENGFESGQERQLCARSVSGRVLVDQPEQKQGCSCADGQDGKDGRSCIGTGFRCCCGGTHSSPQCLAMAQTINVVSSRGGRMTLPLSRSRATMRLSVSLVARRMRVKRMV